MIVFICLLWDVFKPVNLKQTQDTDKSGLTFKAMLMAL